MQVGPGVVLFPSLGVFPDCLGAFSLYSCSFSGFIGFDKVAKGTYVGLAWKFFGGLRRAQEQVQFATSQCILKDHKMN